jgi:hypothetical protein
LNVDLTDKEYKEIVRMREEEERKKEPPVLEIARQFVRAENNYIVSVNSERGDSESCLIKLEKAQRYLIDYKGYK